MDIKGFITQKRIVNIVLTFFVSLLLAYTVFSSQFYAGGSDIFIRIEGTSEKNVASYGTDIRIREIRINHKTLPFTELDFSEEWQESDGLLCAFHSTEASWIEFYAEEVDLLEIIFQKQEGSGYVSIEEGGEKIGTADLYSAEWEEETFARKFGHASISENWTGFLLLLLFVYIEIISLEKLFSKLAKEKKTCLWMAGSIILCLFLFGGSVYYGQAEKGIIMVLAFGVVGNIVLSAFQKLGQIKVGGTKCHLLLLFTGSAVLFEVVENINDNFLNVEIKYALGNIVAYFTLMMFFYLITASVKWSMVIGSIPVLGYGIANYYVTLFRGIPIVPGDFFVLNTAKNVMGNYQYEINWNLFSGVLVWIFCCILMAAAEGYVPRNGRRKTVPLAVMIFAFAFFIGKGSFYHPQMNQWELHMNVKTYGVAMNLISSIRGMGVAAPDGYSYEQIEELCGQYMPEEQNDSFLPNVIAIMNESFSDLSVLCEELDNREYMSYYDSLEENTVKGTFVASTIGGTTANTEFEFLTGNSIGFLAGSVPYQQYILKDTFSLARILKEKGYETSAIHPYYRSGYNRERVYSFFGFDEFLDIESFENPELVRNLYISDKDSYQKVIEVFERIRGDKKPAFIFNVTMQNHSWYKTGYYGEDVIRIPGMEGDFPEVEEYLTLIKESDAAFKVLIDYFGQIKEPTVIIMFGDHQPSVDTSFYEAVIGKPRDQWTLEEAQKTYEVPFFIWANYDIEEDSNILTSANYLSSILFETAGISRTPYQIYLSRLWEQIPAMNINGYLDTEGKWHVYAEKTEETPVLDEYWKLEYNYLFAKKKCQKWFLPE